MNPSTDLIQDIDSFVNKAMQTWNVPGLAIVIVKDEQILLAKGYGVRELDKSELVDEHTLFAIGSNTKAFTATAVGLLVKEGKLDWDDPVTKYLSDFRLHDPYTTQLITVRDLLCHRSGLGTWAGDLLLLSSYSTEEVIRRLRHIPPAYNFRAGYGYSNLMYVTAGKIIELVSGMSWDDFIRQRIFEPLGMNDSVTNPRYLKERNNIAVPHEDVKGKLQTVLQREDAHIGAAGSIHASVADIARWLRLQLNRGQLDGQQIIDPSIIEEMQTPHTIFRLTPEDRKANPSLHFAAYGLGWFLSDLHGRFFARHTGGVDGMLSNVVLIRDEKIGIATFTNKIPNAAFAALPSYLVERLLNIPAQDWIQKNIDFENKGKEMQEQAKKQRDDSRARDTNPSLALEKYTGEYDSLIVGGATVGWKGGGLCIQLQAHESMSGTLEHWHYDTFLCKWDDPVLDESLLSFVTDGQGNVLEFHVKIREDWIDPLEHVFKKKMN